MERRAVAAERTRRTAQQRSQSERSVAQQAGGTASAHARTEAWYPMRHIIPCDALPYATRVPCDDIACDRTVLHATRYPMRHGIPCDTVSHAARCPNEVLPGATRVPCGGIPCDAVSHGIPCDAVSRARRAEQQDLYTLPATTGGATSCGSDGSGFGDRCEINCHAAARRWRDGATDGPYPARAASRAAGKLRQACVGCSPSRWSTPAWPMGPRGAPANGRPLCRTHAVVRWPSSRSIHGWFGAAGGDTAAVHPSFCTPRGPPVSRRAS